MLLITFTVHPRRRPSRASLSKRHQWPHGSSLQVSSPAALAGQGHRAGQRLGRDRAPGRHAQGAAGLRAHGQDGEEQVSIPVL